MGNEAIDDTEDLDFQNDSTLTPKIKKKGRKGILNNHIIIIIYLSIKYVLDTSEINLLYWKAIV